MDKKKCSKCGFVYDWNVTRCPKCRSQGFVAHKESKSDDSKSKSSGNEPKIGNVDWIKIRDINIGREEHVPSLPKTLDTVDPISLIENCPKCNHPLIDLPDSQKFADSFWVKSCQNCNWRSQSYHKNKSEHAKALERLYELGKHLAAKGSCCFCGSHDASGTLAVTLRRSQRATAAAILSFVTYKSIVDVPICNSCLTWKRLGKRFENISHPILEQAQRDGWTIDSY